MTTRENKGSNKGATMTFTSTTTIDISDLSDLGLQTLCDVAAGNLDGEPLPEGLTNADLDALAEYWIKVKGQKAAFVRFWLNDYRQGR